MTFFFVALLIGCFVRFNLELVRKTFRVRIPYSVVLLVVGGGLGYATWDKVEAGAGLSDEAFTRSLFIWSKIDPHMLLFIFLPALIYEGSSATNYYAFTNHFWSAVVLAMPGLLVQSFLIGSVAVYVLPYGWGWTEAVLFGAILSATDPVAVVALLKELGVLPDLRVLIEAESLLNDGTAIVLFQLCTKILLEPGSTLSYVGLSFRLVLGSVALGIAMFMGSYVWLKSTHHPIDETIITVCTAYLAFFVAEGTEVQVSGVLTVVTIGVLMAGVGHTAIEGVHSAEMLHSVWSMIVFCADTTIFVLAGAIIVEQWLALADFWTSSDWGYMMAVYVLLTLIRGVMVGLFSPFIRAFGYGLQPRVCDLSTFIRSMFVVTWGGLRGAVGLCLALAVAMDDQLRGAVADAKYNERVLLMTAGMVVLTTVVNAALMEKVIEWMGLGAVSETQVKLFKGAIRYLADKHEERLEQLQNAHDNPEFAQVDWALLRHHAAADQVLGQHSQVWQELHEWERAAQAASSRELPDSEPQLRAEEEAERASQEASQEALHEMLGRFLLSLRASYTSQWNRGLLAARPFTSLRWALDMALDHLKDARAPPPDHAPDHASPYAEEEEAGSEMEWGWLERQGYLSVSRVAGWLKATPGLRALGKAKEKAELRERFEMVSAVIRAHEETARCEFRADMVDGRLQAKLRAWSDALRAKAQRTLVLLEAAGGPAGVAQQMGAAVRTRQAACVALAGLSHDLDQLLHIAQVTPAEHEILHQAVEGRLEKCKRSYLTWPRRVRDLLRGSTEEAVHALPLFRALPKDQIVPVMDQLQVRELHLEEGDRKSVV